MSEIASQILNSFSALPETEQHEVLVALLRTSGELPSTELTDDDLVNLAEEVFLRLDAEEARMARAIRGEVWLADLGMVAKIRPCMILSIASDDENDRVLTALIPHTTSTRGSRFEVVIDAPFLKTGAFNTQNIVTLPTTKLIRRLGTLTRLNLVKSSVPSNTG